MSAEARGSENERTRIVIVAADSGSLLSDSVASALASEAPVEVVLVDNASTDGVPERVAAIHATDSRFRMLRNEQNLGFGPACNIGARGSHGDALLFLNPDCTIAPDAVASLRAIARANPMIGLLGVDVHTPDGKSARGNRRRDPTLQRAFMTFTGLARLATRWPGLAGVEMPPPSASTPVLEPVEAVSGACLLVTRRAFEAVGGFDEDYFLHVEDLDLCRRVRDVGYQVAIAHAVQARHAQGGSSRRRPLFVAWHKQRGMWRYFRKFDPASRNVVLRAIVFTGIWLRFALVAPFVWLRGRSARSADAVKVDRIAQ
ncbi:MAG: glycosyltransferase family 2 protein [Rhodanobacteraceae bacterium]